MIKKRIFDWLFRDENAEYIFKIRKMCISGKKVRRVIGMYLYHRLMLKNGASIPVQADIQETPVFPHGVHGVFISQGSRIGRSCVIFQHVTIGSNTLIDSKKVGSPRIGDNVYIGAGAKIIGSIAIGNNVRIGANCVVVDDVPDDCTIVASPPRVIVHKSPKDNHFYNWDEVIAIKDIC